MPGLLTRADRGRKPVPISSTELFPHLQRGPNTCASVSPPAAGAQQHKPSSALKSLTVKLTPHVRPKHHCCNVIVIISFIKRGFSFSAQSFPCWPRGRQSKRSPAHTTAVPGHVTGPTPPFLHRVFPWGMLHKERGKHGGSDPLMCRAQTNPSPSCPFVVMTSPWRGQSSRWHFGADQGTEWGISQEHSPLCCSISPDVCKCCGLV